MLTKHRQDRRLRYSLHTHFVIVCGYFLGSSSSSLLFFFSKENNCGGGGGGGGGGASIDAIIEFPIPDPFELHFPTFCLF